MDDSRRNYNEEESQYFGRMYKPNADQPLQKGTDVSRFSNVQNINFGNNQSGSNLGNNQSNVNFGNNYNGTYNAYKNSQNNAFVSNPVSNAPFNQPNIPSQGFAPNNQQFSHQQYQQFNNQQYTQNPNSIPNNMGNIQNQNIYNDFDYNNNHESLMNAEQQKKRKNGLFGWKNKKIEQQGYEMRDVVITYPQSLSDVQVAIDSLRNGQSIIADLSKVNDKNSQRIMDYLSGATYALDGSQQRINENMFLFTPGGVSIQGPRDLQKRFDK